MRDALRNKESWGKGAVRLPKILVLTHLGMAALGEQVADVAERVHPHRNAVHHERHGVRLHHVDPNSWKIGNKESDHPLPESVHPLRGYFGLQSYVGHARQRAVLAPLLSRLRCRLSYSRSTCPS